MSDVESFAKNLVVLLRITIIGLFGAAFYIAFYGKNTLVEFILIGIILGSAIVSERASIAISGIITTGKVR